MIQVTLNRLVSVSYHITDDEWNRRAEKSFKCFERYQDGIRVIGNRNTNIPSDVQCTCWHICKKPEGFPAFIQDFPELPKAMLERPKFMQRLSQAWQDAINAAVLAEQF